MSVFVLDSQPSLLGNHAVLIKRSLSKHRVVDVDRLPAYSSRFDPLNNWSEDGSLNVVGRHNRRHTWNASSVSTSPPELNGRNIVRLVSVSSPSVSSVVGNQNFASTSLRRNSFSQGSLRTALVIDSNALSQRLTSVSLYCSGFTSCDIASHGVAGVTMARLQRYDLILMTTSLSTPSAIETTCAIRFDEVEAGYSQVPILTLTSHVDKATLSSCEQACMNGCIERGAVVSQVVPDMLEVLRRNPNFLFVKLDGTKVQAPYSKEPVL